MEKTERRDPVVFKAMVEVLRERVRRILERRPDAGESAFCRDVLAECREASTGLDHPSAATFDRVGQLPWEHEVRLSEIEKRLGLR